MRFCVTWCESHNVKWKKADRSSCDFIPNFINLHSNSRWKSIFRHKPRNSKDISLKLLWEFRIIKTLLVKWRTFEILTRNEKFSYAMEFRWNFESDPVLSMRSVDKDSGLVSPVFPVERKVEGRFIAVDMIGDRSCRWPFQFVILPLLQGYHHCTTLKSLSACVDGSVGMGSGWKEKLLFLEAYLFLLHSSFTRPG